MLQLIVFSAIPDAKPVPTFAGIALDEHITEATMIFRQLFDSVSGTYTYLIASRRGGEALIIDPVLEKVDRYMQLVRELDLKLVKAVDTHVHADHITGLGELRNRTQCITIMGEHSGVDVVSMRVADGDRIDISDGLRQPARGSGRSAEPFQFLFRSFIRDRPVQGPRGRGTAPAAARGESARLSGDFCSHRRVLVA